MVLLLLLLLLLEINEGVVVSPLCERPGEVDCSICPVREREGAVELEKAKEQVEGH